MTEQERWVTFFYLLLRDSVPVGEVTRLVQEVEAIKEQDSAVFTNNELEVLAQSLVERIRKQ